MDFHPNGSRPSVKGPAETFTGNVRIDPLFKHPPPARALGSAVTFEPCSRTVWHTHPLGQTLIVTAGFGLVQSWGAPARLLRPGDVVWCPPAEKHWHGARPDTAVSHLAIVEELDGRGVDWLEPLPDADYQAAARSAV
jgi:quercetin dioxygenase-like cupin family protein